MGQPTLQAWRPSQRPPPPGAPWRRFRRTAASAGAPATPARPGALRPPRRPGRPPAPGWPGERSAPAARRRPEPRARAAGYPAAVALGPGIPGPEPLEAAFPAAGIPGAELLGA